MRAYVYVCPSYSPHHYCLAATLCAPFFLPTSICSVYRVLYSVCRTRQLLSCSTVEVPPGCCLQVGTSVLVWAGVAVGWLICSLHPSLLPLCVSSGKSLCGRAGCRSLMPVPNCMFSAGRSVFWCPLAGAESDFCGRNGLWKGLIFRHNRVFVQNQGAVLKKRSLRGVHPGDFPSRQG